jgi:predicted glycosyltransferase
MKQGLTILMYSHDTYGLGHIRRTLAIAKALAEKAIHILIITGSPLAGQFPLPGGVDFIRIPGMVKTEKGDYLPSCGGISKDRVMKIRTQLILATIKTLEPDLFIVDKEPLGLKKEVLPGLAWILRHLPHTGTILGLRDVMDEAA